MKILKNLFIKKNQTQKKIYILSNLNYELVFFSKQSEQLINILLNASNKKVIK